MEEAEELACWPCRQDHFTILEELASPQRAHALARKLSEKGSGLFRKRVLTPFLLEQGDHQKEDCHRDDYQRQYVLPFGEFAGQVSLEIGSGLRHEEESQVWR
jgi:hypothetical protein